MLDYLISAYHWLKQRLTHAGLVWQVIVGAIALAVVYFLITYIPSVRLVKDWYGQASPTAQVTFLVIILLILMVMIVVAMDGRHQTKLLKSEKAAAEAKQAEAEEFRKEAEAEVSRLQAQWDHLLVVGCKDELWKRHPRVVPIGFVPKLNRKTRFVTMLNLKGGVGKTTLATNLAAGLAKSEKPLRVLLVDIDFQGTLSRASVERSLIGVQVGNGSLVNRLLTTQDHAPGLANRLAVPMNGVKDAKVILTDEDLDTTEFQVQARFFVDGLADPRYQFRLHLHRSDVFESFDVVLFDCPPRITASVVNAVACSDYVLIPTKLDTGSIDAIPRTLAWMRGMGSICQAELLGVLASHVTLRSGKPIQADNASYEYLRGVVQSECGNGELLFQSVVQLSSKAVNGDGVIASQTTDGRRVFAPVVEEMRKRMGL